MSYLIQADTVVFKNPYQDQDITLKHDVNGYSFVFGSDVEFRGDATHTAVKFGDYIITKDDDKLTFKRGNNILMTLHGSK
tara:strand:+ start:1379 stop:1618 length:240 start_codon:yes stop_codon:yes gene_type:complete